jgi:hypothetical protein
MSIEFFNDKGKFLKGNLHGHSNHSDGKIAPDEVCEAYIEKGYNFISITDHFLEMFNYPITSPESKIKNFTVIPGAEFHTSKMGNGELWHLLALGINEKFTPPKQPNFLINTNSESIESLSSRLFEAGAFVSLTHPEWNGMTLQDTLKIEKVHAIEIYNHSCAIECDRGSGVAVLDQILNHGKKINTIATDDSHFHIDDAFGGWVMVKAEINSVEAILKALKNGHYYSSQGPDFKGIKIQNGRLEVLCSPVEKIIVSGYGSATAYKHKSDTESAIFNLGLVPQKKWIRVTIIDKEGNRAWTNPIYDY